MPSKEILRLKIGTHEIAISCCGGAGKCESGGGVLLVSEPVEKGDVERNVIETCLPFTDALAFRDSLSTMLIAMAVSGEADKRSAKLRLDMTALNEAVNKVREELSVGV